MLSLMFLQASDTGREIHSTQTCHCLLMTLHTKWLLEHCLFPCFHWLLFVSWHLICTSYVKTHSWNMTSIISFNLQDKPNSINSTILKCWWGMMVRSSVRQCNLFFNDDVLWILCLLKQFTLFKSVTWYWFVMGNLHKGWCRLQH